MEAEEGYTSQDTGNTVRGNREEALCLEGTRRHLRSLSLARVPWRELTPGFYNPYGGPTLWIREIHAPNWKHTGNQASKKALPPSSTVGLSGRNSQPRKYPSSLRTSSCITRPEVAPSSSGEVVEYTSPTTNQSLRDCSMTPFPWCICKIVHLVKTMKIIENATLLFLISCTGKLRFLR
ncbi:PREDICTED: uncharacterized protein LOC101401292 [Ceratotherium simum simum]|uniref:Uncharacterized protein LOC101401292 n=1 Tax=Ceratotherium simum simum TaxID=73337 RepID=A0ABM0I9U5_CERSS|nr:PREDICTED: uncharacterized protein LOC101401292 [Ceratotherium simum simum]